MLELREVSAGYGHVEVLHDVSFAVAAGQKLALLGPNGCGKSTLLKCIVGILDYRGEITLDGRNLRSLKRVAAAREIALLSQNPAVYFSYSVHDAVAMGLYAQTGTRIFSSPTPAQRATVDAALESTGLTSLRDQPIDQLSGGQLQRVFLARTIVQNPRVLLLDEPNNHLDIRYQLDLLRYLDDWLDEDRIIVGVFHDINLAIHFSTNVLVLDDGRIAAAGSASEVLQRPFLRDLYAADVVEYLADSGRFWIEQQS